MSDERVLFKGRFADLIRSILNITDPNDGTYMLYTPANITTLQADMRCAVILMFYEDEDDFMPPFALAHNLSAASDIRTIKNIYAVAKLDRPELTTQEFTAAVNYYLSHDAFIKFD